MPHPIRFIPRLADIDPAAWNALAGSQPCVQHAFLSAFEHSGAVGPGSGWHPRHATLWSDGQLIAAMPLYEKWHSWGEYVFDWAWAQAYEQHGLAYYPKWLSAIPFTPVPGRRLLGVSEAARTELLEAVLARVRASEHSSFHVLFPTAADARLLEGAGLMLRDGVQFHWQNAGYADFEAFLASLNRDKRKKIRQERRRVREAGITFRWLRGDEIDTEALEFFYRCYALTYALRRSMPYLNEAFFAQVHRDMPAHTRLLVADRAGEPVACAWFLMDDEALYGRYWGALEDISCLHFETCYYQAIEYAIAQGLQRFEGGAQGEHKLSRGLLSTPTCSAHWIRDTRFADAIDDFLRRERQGMSLYLDELNERQPFRTATAK
ncbi:N-acetyltransferase [Nitrogeniibacter mangrovi]|uniref:N-acetyltransferase n=1 Tax=Nitrogeniibacter mangrovi TaxID=2016596 RepID=A0A6C1B1I3_9RHOO|nr:GNAT family N-acetyltransferase [Nitrogeniibacter mangrovi]QID17223.1 N-acetyltransferase [Nitrogeniibacter mangrovi]